ncbi:MAG: hypothetical protein ACI3V3_03330 [Faecousia sp.]
MTNITLLERLKLFTEDAIKDIILPVRLQKGDTEQKSRAADVYLMRLPDSTAATKKAPYIIHQFVTGKDSQPAGRQESGRSVVRSVFCVYCENEQDGAMNLLNLMERMRIRLLQQVVIGQQYQLDLEAGVEMLIYPEDSAPYYAGEMSTTWKMPSVEREWRQCL